MSVPVTPSSHERSSPNVKTVSDFLRSIRLGAEVRSEAQQFEANRTGTLNRWVGGIAAALAAVGGTSAFASLSTSEDRLLLIGAAVFSAAAAVIIGLQTFLNYGARSAEHQKAAAEAADLQYRVDIALLTVDATTGTKQLEDFGRELAELPRNASGNTYQKAVRLISKRHGVPPESLI